KPARRAAGSGIVPKCWTNARSVVLFPVTVSNPTHMVPFQYSNRSCAAKLGGLGPRLTLYFPATPPVHPLVSKNVLSTSVFAPPPRFSEKLPDAWYPFVIIASPVSVGHTGGKMPSSKLSIRLGPSMPLQS